MTRKRLVLVAGALVLSGFAAMTSACDSGTTTSVFDGDCATSIVQVASLPTDPVGSARFELTGECDFINFGDFTVESEQFFTDPDANGDFAITGSTLYTDEDGNTLNSSVAGDGNLAGDQITFDGVETYNGGSGIFNGVAGSSDFAGTGFLGLGNGLVEYTIDGTLETQD